MYPLNDVFSPSVSFNSDINELTEPVLKKWLKSRKKTLCDIMNNQVMEYLLYSKVCVPLSLSLSFSLSFLYNTKIPSERHDKFKAGRKEKCKSSTLHALLRG